MKRPNVARMRRAMERGEAYRLRRRPEMRVPLWDGRSADQIEAEAKAWAARVSKHFPGALLTVERDYSRDEVVARWRPRHD